MDAPAVETRVEELSERPGRLVRFVAEGRALSTRDVAARLTHEPPFRARFNASIVDSPHRAIFWECRAASSTAPDEPFEAAILYAPALVGVAPTPQPFEEHFEGSDELVVVFDNLGGDATLVVPTPRAPGTVYPHLAAFVRGAPSEQVDALWAAVGRAVTAHLDRSEAPVWLNTSGLGVFWTHVRLDARPKYYSYGPFRALPAGA